MKIGYVREENPFCDKRAWSGLIYKIREAVENAGYEVIWVPYSLSPWKDTLLKCILKLLYGRKFAYERHPLYYWMCARSLDNNLLKKCDVLFFPGGAQIMPHVKCNVPYVYYVDATLAIFADYYGSYSRSSLKWGNKTEQRAIDNCALMFHASEWSRQSAISLYGSKPEKNFVLEFGANLDDTDIVRSSTYDGGGLNILFSGVDWVRKGAETAIKTVCLLNERGIKSKLFLCGIREIPQEYSELPDCVVNCGFFDKNDANQYSQYVEIIKKCHLFLLPTKAECAGIVFSESSAYGLPIFTYNTGGVGNYVIDGVNGYKLPVGSAAEDFAKKIIEVISENQITTLSDGGIKLYQERLSWHSWSRRFRKIMDTHFSKND